MSDRSPETPRSPLDPTYFHMGDASTPFVPSAAINHVVVSSKTTKENKEELEAELTEHVNDGLAGTPPRTVLPPMIRLAQTVEAEKEVIELKLLQANATAQEDLANKNAELANKNAELANKNAELANKNAELANKIADLANTDAIIANRDADLAKLGPFEEGGKVHVFWLEHGEVHTDLAEPWNGEILEVGPNDNYLIRFKRNPRDSKYWDEVWHHETSIRRGWLE